MPTRNRAHLDTRLEAFCNDLSLDLIRPVAPTRRTFQDLKSADVAPSRNQQMLHRLFQRFAPNQNAKLAQTTLTENPLKPWGARTAYGPTTAEQGDGDRAIRYLQIGRSGTPAECWNFFKAAGYAST